jgi:hypothetical protein
MKKKGEPVVKGEKKDLQERALAFEDIEHKSHSRHLSHHHHSPD